jgi:hypothetical protein
MAMKKTRSWYLVLGVCGAGLVAWSCGRQENPVAPASDRTAAAPADGAAAASGRLPDVSTVNATQGWTVRDGCSDGKGLTFRLWEAKGLALTGRATRVFKTKSGGAPHFNLVCVKGNNDCIGADTNPVTGAVWGVGLYAQKRAAKPFCRVCAAGSVSLTLVCRKAANGAIEPQLVEDGGLDASGFDLGASSFSEDEGDVGLEAAE